MSSYLVSITTYKQKHWTTFHHSVVLKWKIITLWSHPNGGVLLIILITGRRRSFSSLSLICNLSPDFALCGCFLFIFFGILLFEVWWGKDPIRVPLGVLRQVKIPCIINIPWAARHPTSPFYHAYTSLHFFFNAKGTCRASTSIIIFLDLKWLMSVGSKIIPCALHKGEFAPHKPDEEGKESQQ